MIYEFDGLYGVKLLVQNKEFFMATDPVTNSLVVSEVKPGQLRLAGVTWTDTIAPPQQDEFALREWNAFLRDAIMDVYDELCEEFEDDLLYDEKDDVDLLPWNEDVRAAARRAFTRYALDSEWARSWTGQEKAIEYTRMTVSERMVKAYHRLLYQTECIDNHAKHRKATFLAVVVLKLLSMLASYQRRKEEHGTSLRSERRSRRREPL